MHYLVDMLANSLEAIVFSWWCELLLSGQWQHGKMLLKNSKSGTPMPMKLIGVKEASQSINIRIKRGASMWLRIFGGGKFHSFLPTRKGKPLKLCSSQRCSSVLSPCLQGWQQRGRSLLKRRERKLPTFISPTPKFSKERNLQ